MTGIPEFIYHRPASVEEACKLGLDLGEKARFLAGGTELLVDLKEGRDSADHLIALKRIPELDMISLDKGSLVIGALTTLADICRSETVRCFLPALCDAISDLGSEQIRNQGTIGGNFCGAVPCADTPPVCIAAGAGMRISGTGSQRHLPASEFFLAPRRSALEPGELLTAIEIPEQPESSGTSYKRFSLRHGSALAVASVAVRLVLREEKIAEASVVLGAVAPVPLTTARCIEVLVGEPPSDDIFRNAGRIAAEEATPITDIRGSEGYRRELVEVLTFRALKSAVEMAGGGKQ